MRNDPLDPTVRFGQDPADSAELVRLWRETQPTSDHGDWSSFWDHARFRVESDAPKPTGLMPASRWVVAASLAIVAVLSSNRIGYLVDPNPKTDRIVANAGSSEPVLEGLTRNDVVSIDIDENDDLAVIRLDDFQCPAHNPCTESVESYGADDSIGTSLASNFLLFNEMESLSGE